MLESIERKVQPKEPTSEELFDELWNDANLDPLKIAKTLSGKKIENLLELASHRQPGDFRKDLSPSEPSIPIDYHEDDSFRDSSKYFKPSTDKKEFMAHERFTNILIEALRITSEQRPSGKDH